MGEILELLCFGFLCKNHIFNFKSGVSQPKTGVQYFGNFQKKWEKNKNWAKIQKCQKWSPEFPASIWGHFEWNMSQIRELLAILCSELLCKTHIFNFKTVVSQPIFAFSRSVPLPFLSFSVVFFFRVLECQRCRRQTISKDWHLSSGRRPMYIYTVYREASEI